MLVIIENMCKNEGISLKLSACFSIFLVRRSILFGRPTHDPRKIRINRPTANTKVRFRNQNNCKRVTGFSMYRWKSFRTFKR